MKLFRNISSILFFAFSICCFAIPASAQSNSSIRKTELERVGLDQIPLPGYADPRPGDVAGPTEPAYTYWAYIESIRDVDTVKGQVDLGFNSFREFGFRYFAIDGFEITRKGGRSASHVDRGFKCRDLMVDWLGSDQEFPRKATYHEFYEPIKIVVKSVKSDKYSGRWLFILYKDGVNLNQLAARSGCAIVTTFESKPVYYPVDTPIAASIE